MAPWCHDSESAVFCSLNCVWKDAEMQRRTLFVAVVRMRRSERRRVPTEPWPAAALACVGPGHILVLINVSPGPTAGFSIFTFHFYIFCVNSSIGWHRSEDIAEKILNKTLKSFFNRNCCWWFRSVAMHPIMCWCNIKNWVGIFWRIWWRHEIQMNQQKEQTQSCLKYYNYKNICSRF